eukprot:UN27298
MSLLNLPVIGRIFRAGRMIPVDRYTKGGKKLAMDRMLERAQNPTTPVVIFPQGTLTPQNVLTQFKWGAFKPGEPVCPVIYTYPNVYGDLNGANKGDGLGYMVCIMPVYQLCTS